MSKAIITITDSGADDVDVKVDFGSDGIKDGSTAHYLAAKTLAYLLEQGEAEVTTKKRSSE